MHPLLTSPTNKEGPNFLLKTACFPFEDNLLAAFTKPLCGARLNSEIKVFLATVIKRNPSSKWNGVNSQKDEYHFHCKWECDAPSLLLLGMRNFHGRSSDLGRCHLGKRSRPLLRMRRCRRGGILLNLASVAAILPFINN
ncbi:hypothetical protein AVEN_265844-1 [Araneus ventricosus]|uniref:Uncharacterized protein n=1 Tax=Araneus ventricosus TaxID=182803 RepID=A0A4Y2FDB0_ARAVE|nr:hypothetical protein AVEN_265844-1 [Araneus ventricosus]